MQTKKLVRLAADLLGVGTLPADRLGILEQYDITFKRIINEAVLDPDFLRALVYVLNGEVSSEFHASRVFAFGLQAPLGRRNDTRCAFNKLRSLELKRLQEKKRELREEIEQIDKEIGEIEEGEYDG